jgi:hypothetical protein
MTDQLTPEQTAAAALQTKVDELTKTLETQKATLDTRMADTERQLAFAQGQLASLSKPVESPEDVRLDSETVLNDPQKALDDHWNKRAKPFVDASYDREAKRERSLLEIKRAKDVEKFGKEVDQIASKMSPEVLAQPGTYEGLLDLIKSKHTDELVKEQVAAEVARFQAEAAKTAAASTAAPAPASPAKAEDIKFDDAQVAVMRKMGVDPKRAAEFTKDTAFDGVLITGPGGVH